MNAMLDIDVYFDFICPWCLIGKRHLERALDQLDSDYPGLEVRVQWHGVQLLNGVPNEGVDFKSFYRHRLGSESAVNARQQQVHRAASEAGLSLNLSRITTLPNTAAAHRFFLRSASLGTQAQHEALLDRMFAAYFFHSKNLGDPRVLLELALACGYQASDLEPALRPGQGQFLGSNGDGIGGGVPLFVFNRIVHRSGALPWGMLRADMDRALALPVQGVSS